MCSNGPFSAADFIAHPHSDNWLRCLIRPWPRLAAGPEFVLYWRDQPGAQVEAACNSKTTMGQTSGPGDTNGQQLLNRVTQQLASVQRLKDQLVTGKKKPPLNERSPLNRSSRLFRFNYHNQFQGFSRPRHHGDGQAPVGPGCCAITAAPICAERAERKQAGCPMCTSVGPLMSPYLRACLRPTPPWKACRAVAKKRLRLEPPGVFRRPRHQTGFFPPIAGTGFRCSSATIDSAATPAERRKTGTGSPRLTGNRLSLPQTNSASACNPKENLLEHRLSGPENRAPATESHPRCPCPLLTCTVFKDHQGSMFVASASVTLSIALAGSLPSGPTANWTRW